ncbi:MAG TPA: hypothetical protein VGB64_07715 [Actinomycetota bacterium]
MNSQHAAARSRTRSRILTMLVLCLSMTAFTIDRAHGMAALDPQLSQLAGTGSVTSVSPFTYVNTINGVTATTKISEPSAETLIMSVDVAGISVQTQANNNGDGTATYTTTGPNGYTSVVTKPATVSASGGCNDWSCIAAIGGAVVVTGAVCFFSAGLACGAAGAGSGGAAAAYCELHNCESEPKCPEHNVDAWNATGTPGIPGRAVHYQNSVNCNFKMQYFKLTTQLFRGSTPVFSPHTKWCYETNNCWDGWIGYNLPAGCYRTYGAFEARWHDPTTNATKDFSGAKWSGTVCV